MSIKPHIVDLTQDETKPDTESEIIELDKSSNEETGVYYHIIDSESDNEENLNKDLNLEGKINNDYNVLTLDSNGSTVEDLELGLVLFDPDKVIKKEKFEDIYANKDQNEKMHGEKVYLKGSCANVKIEGENAKTDLELVLVNNGGLEGNKNCELEKTRDQNEKNDTVTDIVNMELDLPLISLKKEKRKKGRNENTKDKMDQNAKLSLSLVIHNPNENSNKRVRKKSIYLSSPFINTFKRPKLNNFFSNPISPIKEHTKKMPNSKNNKPKKDKFIKNALSDLKILARNPNPKLLKSAKFKSSMDFFAKFRKSVNKGLYYIHKEPGALLLIFKHETILPTKEDLIAKFSKFGALLNINISHLNDKVDVVFARKKDAESAFNWVNDNNNKKSKLGEFWKTGLRYLPAGVAGPLPAVILDMREKLEGFVESLNGSGSGFETGLIEDTKALLEKVNLALSTVDDDNNQGLIGYCSQQCW